LDWWRNKWLFIASLLKIGTKTHPSAYSLMPNSGVDISRVHSLRRRVIIGAAQRSSPRLPLPLQRPGGDARDTVSRGFIPAGPVIDLSSLMFHPSTTTVKVGTTITWRNDEAITHTVTSGRFVESTRRLACALRRKPTARSTQSSQEKAKPSALRSPNPALTPTTATFTRA
jgi:hypothetical protein